MIDIEASVFRAVKDALGNTAKCLPSYQNTSATYPLVTVEEQDNSVYERTRDSALIENHAVLLYEVNVFSNTEAGKKRQAKNIMATVDTAMREFGFTRTYCRPTPNFADSTIFRLTARYSAVVDQSGNLYRR